MWETHKETEREKDGWGWYTECMAIRIGWSNIAVDDFNLVSIKLSILCVEMGKNVNKTAQLKSEKRNQFRSIITNVYTLCNSNGFVKGKLSVAHSIYQLHYVENAATHVINAHAMCKRWGVCTVHACKCEAKGQRSTNIMNMLMDKRISICQI